VVVLYNGSGGTPSSWIKTAQINPKTGENVWTNICSPVTFNYKDRKKWTLHDNTNKYAEQIAKLLPPNPNPLLSAQE
jgi:hypothetical protein